MKIALQAGMPDWTELEQLLREAGNGGADSGLDGWRLPAEARCITAYDGGTLVGFGVGEPGAGDFTCIISPGYELRGIPSHMRKLIEVLQPADASAGAAHELIS
ncbi:hypothetical protein J31TS4_20720 [Paenibacillus sp. J31TS4]|uniref:hypothetical protein n=1 Tax=Paenibacillus sp. J31TS4 TaxID=2807195 RepID=UPI001B2F7009|nr:hypothetical protein [Paenibacillus sp. J31TS4]GIP38792.1 hypothetical protein J31TS4_20720 [Paenibacillus sp. J31TS4]